MIVFAAPIEQHPWHLRFFTNPTMTNQDAASPASNLLNYDPTKVARTTQNTTAITWDFGSPRIFDVVSLVSSSVGPRGKWSVEISMDGSTWTAPVFNQPFWAHQNVTPGAGPYTEASSPYGGALERNSSWFMSPGLLTARYISVSVSDPDATNLTFGRLFVGRKYQPKINMQYGSSLKFDDTGTRDRTSRGALVVDHGRAILGASVKMDFLSDNDMYDYIWDFNYWRKSTREMLVCLDTTAPAKSRMQKNLLYCNIVEGRQVSADAFNTWSQVFNLESI